MALSVPQHQRHADRRAVHRIQTGLPPSCLLISRRGHLQLRRIDFIDLLAFVRLADAAGCHWQCSSCIAAVLLGAKEDCGRAGESESTRSPSPDGPGRPLGPPRLGPRGPPQGTPGYSAGARTLRSGPSPSDRDRAASAATPAGGKPGTPSRTQRRRRAPRIMMALVVMTGLVGRCHGSVGRIRRACSGRRSEHGRVRMGQDSFIF